MRWSKKIKKFSLFLVGLLLLMACDEKKSPEDVKGPVSQAGGLYTRRRYYVDREGITNDENKVNPYIVEGEVGSRIYWSLIDPDDPANDNTIDPNGPDGDDNEGKKSDFYGSGVYYEGSAAYSTINEDGYTECYFDIEPDEIIGDAKFYMAGDNFQVKATKDSPSGSVYSQSVTFSVWKKIRKIEYDWMATPPEATEYEDTDIFSKYPGLFRDLQTFFSDETKPNRLTYVEIDDNALIDISDPEDLFYSEPREWSTLPLDEVLIAIDSYKDNENYVYIFSMVALLDEEYNVAPVTGMSAPMTARGEDGFSVVFWGKIKWDAEDFGLNEYNCVRKVLIHELGHQLVNLEDYDDFPGNHTDNNCIMRQGLEGGLINDFHFCSRCVVNFRQYFMTF